MIEQLFSPDLVHALGWTLVHTLWQAAIYALLLGVLLVLLRKYSALTRYLVAIGMLGAFFLTAGLTFYSIYAPGHTVPVRTEVVAEPVVLSPSPSPAERGARAKRASTSPLSAGEGPGERSISFRERVVTYYNNHLPLIVTLWLMGVLILQLRFLGQLAFIQRLKNYGVERFPPRYAPLIQELERKIGVSKPVRYLSSFRVKSPFTAGWLRPVILFPAVLLEELREDQLRTILAHELAHVKRYDFLVNLGQTLLCILFFYHPAVWWMSARVEEEREHCCDDLAIAVTGEKVGYAKTLLQLKETEISAGRLAMHLKGSGKGFQHRIRRLLGDGLGTGSYGEGFTTAVIIACCIALALNLSGQENKALTQVQSLDQAAMESADPATLSPEESAALTDDLSTLLEKEATDNLSDRVTLRRALQQEARQLFDRAPHNDKFALLMNAIREGSLELVTYFLENEEFFLNETDERGFTPLMAAASENHVAIVRLLLDAGADISFINPSGWTALHEAADEGSFETVELLLEAGADPNLKGPQESRTPLAMAASEGHPQIISLLVAAGADVFSVNGENHPLHEAAEEGQLRNVQLLVELNSEVDVTDEDGRTPLSYAAEEGQTEVVNFLLRENATADSKDKSGRSPLSYAAEEGQPRVVRLLLQAGADPTSKDSRGRTPLDYALAEMEDASFYWQHDRNRHTPQTSNGADYQMNHPLGEVVLLLHEAGATSPRLMVEGQQIILIGDNDEHTDLDFHFDGNFDPAEDGTQRYSGQAVVDAVRAGQNELIDRMIGKGADLDGTGKNGRTPLTEASFHNYNIHSHQLVRGGADINKADENGYTPLTMAVTHNHFSTTEHLLDMGADPDLADRNGMTAKEIALRDNHFRVLRLLNEKGASVTAVTPDGVSPLEIPAREGNLTTLTYLLEQGVKPDAGRPPTPLFYAANEGHPEIIRELARYGANMNPRNDYRDTDYFGRPSPGKYATYALYSGATPLMAALTQTDLKSIQALIEAGANINASCNKLRFQLREDLDWNQRERLTEKVLRKQHDLTYEANGWTPLMEAVESGNGDLVVLLLKNGADRNATTQQGLTALQLAQDLQLTTIIRILQ